MDDGNKFKPAGSQLVRQCLIALDLGIRNHLTTSTRSTKWPKRGSSETVGGFHSFPKSLGVSLKTSQHFFSGHNNHPIAIGTTSLVQLPLLAELGQGFGQDLDLGGFADKGIAHHLAGNVEVSVGNDGIEKWGSKQRIFRYSNRTSPMFFGYPNFFGGGVSLET